LEEKINRIKRELASKESAKQQVEVEWENKLKNIENEQYNKDYQLQHFESKLKNQESVINNLNYTVKEYENEILNLMNATKDTDAHKTKSKKMEDTAYALDDEKYELLQELSELKHSHETNSSKQKQLEGQITILTRELQHWADQEQQLLEEINQSRNEVNKTKVAINQQVYDQNIINQMEDDIKTLSKKNDDLADSIFE